MSEVSLIRERLAELASSRHQDRICGAQTAWWSYGSAEDTDLIIGIHGFRGDHHGLEPIFAFLPEFQIVLPDLPGFGESEPLSREHTLDAYIAWLSEFVDEMKRIAPPNTRVVLLGHSFGSIIVAAAVASGISVDGVILVNPISAPALEGPRAILTRAAIGYYRAGSVLPESWGNRLLRSRLIVRLMSISMAKNPEKAMRRFVHEQHDTYFSRFSHRDMLLESFRTSVSHNVSEFLPKVTVPSLLIAAERDDITPLEAQRQLNQLVPRSRLEVIPQVGHLIHYETPAVAAIHIREFMKKLAS